MGNPNILPSNEAVLLAAINPLSATGQTLTSGWVSLANNAALQAIIQTGALSTTATVDAKLQQAQDDSGTGIKDISGKAITQLVDSTGDNKQAIINCRGDELDVDNLFTHVRLSVTAGDTGSPTEATALVSGLVFGHHGRYQPTTDATSVAQVVS